jgi:hypothetical protein
MKDLARRPGSHFYDFNGTAFPVTSWGRNLGTEPFSEVDYTGLQSG